MTDILRRRIIQSLGASAALGPMVARQTAAQSSKADIVIAAAQPVTGPFSFAGELPERGSGRLRRVAQC